MESYALTVIMPLYNQESLFRIGLDSIPARDDIEIIVIDDGSTDNSLEEVRNYQLSSRKNIVVLHNEQNKGEAYSANRGIDEAKGKYIVRLDSDGDYFINLENAMPYLDGTDMVYYCFQVNSGDIWGVRADERTHAGGAAKFIRKEFLGDLRHPRLEVGCDSELYKKLLEKKPTERFLKPDVMLYHYNYPRQGSQLWRLQNGEVKTGQTRED